MVLFDSNPVAYSPVGQGRQAQVFIGTRGWGKGDLTLLMHMHKLP